MDLDASGAAGLQDDESICSQIGPDDGLVPRSSEFAPKAATERARGG